jgi:pyruvate dehydrogenase E2 component (dihydrolipoyllysine-residue acetyltransferase)
MADIVTMPKLGFDMAEGVLIRWAKAEGDTVAKGDLLAEIETDKATVEVESNFSGMMRRRLVDEGAIVPVGDPIAVIAAEDEEINLDGLVASAEPNDKAVVVEEDIQEKTPVSVAQVTAEDESGTARYDGASLPGGVRASPLARRMADEAGIDLANVNGTGSGGRITKKDIQTFLTTGAAKTTSLIEAHPPAIPSWREPLPDEEIALSRLRIAIGRRMAESKQQLPHFYVTSKYDMAPVMSLRKQINEMLVANQVKLTVNDFVMKAVALSLREFPNLNASLVGDKVHHHGRINIGVAVSVENGLLTVVCHDTDIKSLAQLSVEVREKADRARQGKVRPDDVEGSTFTVSNLGMFDVEEFIAIINPPEAAILAVGSVQEVPVIEAGEVKAGLRMKATISVDHRVSDGAEAARYLQTLGHYLEEPLRLMI